MENQNNQNINQPELKKAKAWLHKTLPKIFGALGLVIIASIICGGALLASHVWNPSWNPFKKQSNTDKIIREKIKDKIR